MVSKKDHPMTTVADFVWQRLQEWGVRRVFGYPGDGIGGLIGALAHTKGAMDFVQVRHGFRARQRGLAARATAGRERVVTNGIARRHLAGILSPRSVLGASVQGRQ